MSTTSATPTIDEQKHVPPYNPLFVTIPIILLSLALVVTGFVGIFVDVPTGASIAIYIITGVLLAFELITVSPLLDLVEYNPHFLWLFMPAFLSIVGFGLETSGYILGTQTPTGLRLEVAATVLAVISLVWALAQACCVSYTKELTEMAESTDSTDSSDSMGD